jgi:HSP20 family molecular chaperone IbpA
MSKKNLFQRVIGGLRFHEAEAPEETVENKKVGKQDEKGNWLEEGSEEGELTVDVYQTPAEIIVQTFVAGVRLEDLNISIMRDMITIKGKREGSRNIADEDYFVQELYWGAFSRTILLPQEIEPSETEATEKHGLLVIRLPKIDKAKKTTLKVKSV